ncbi:tRNA adenosine(34) deaminase TadA [Variovorax dokdonensis]|nr:tRNA adenosine(34) deaminase TadA [Variovorax dokdonensis]
MPVSSDERWMALAIEQARAAEIDGEVPVGAVLVKDGQLLAVGRNAPVACHDPTAHAEVAALREAARTLGNYRLDGCELFVTLEPCAMCAGAMLHARLSRVVFGAADPRTGAAGSVLDLFADPRLNHQTQVVGGVLASACAEVLQTFFQARRNAARDIAQPLRDDALRTPAARFAALPPPDWPVRYCSDLPALSGLQLAWLDTAADARAGAFASPTVVCLHGAGQWSQQMLPLVSALLASGCPRVLAPDLIGFGRSDKPKRASVHTIEWHRDVLAQWLTREAPGPLVLLAVQSMRELAEALAAIVPVRGLVVVPEEDAPGMVDEWRAPFPDRGHEAALRGFARAKGPRRVATNHTLRAVHEAMGYFAP